MVPISAGPVGLRPEDPRAVPVRPAPGGLLHKSGGAAHKTRDEAVLQKQQMQEHSHFGTAARREVCTNSLIQSNKNGMKWRTRQGDRRNGGQKISSCSLPQELPLNYSSVTVGGKGEEKETETSPS